jgi:hypothetical protein
MPSEIAAFAEESGGDGASEDGPPFPAPPRTERKKGLGSRGGPLPAGAAAPGPADPAPPAKWPGRRDRPAQTSRRPGDQEGRGGETRRPRFAGFNRPASARRRRGLSGGRSRSEWGRTGPGVPGTGGLATIQGRRLRAGDPSRGLRRCPAARSCPRSIPSQRGRSNRELPCRPRSSGPGSTRHPLTWSRSTGHFPAYGFVAPGVGDAAGPPAGGSAIAQVAAVPGSDDEAGDLRRARPWGPGRTRAPDGRRTRPGGAGRPRQPTGDGRGPGALVGQGSRRWCGRPRPGCRGARSEPPGGSRGTT